LFQYYFGQKQYIFKRHSLLGGSRPEDIAVSVVQVAHTTQKSHLSRYSTGRVASSKIAPLGEAGVV
jgi:hypothetical protein